MSEERPVTLKIHSSPAHSEFYIYEPEEDITTYELALLLPLFCITNHEGRILIFKNLPPQAMRHFRKGE